MNIISAFQDPKLFGSLIKDQKTWASWKVFLRGLFALPMKPAELEVFKEFTGRLAAPADRPSEAYAIVGRRGGKSFVSAIIAVYLACFHDWKPYLAKGENGWVMVIAADRQQARVIFGYIRGILSLPIFKKEIEKELSEEIQLKNKIIISVKTSDFRTLRGFTCVAAVCDELAYWRSEGLNPAGEILNSLRPALATVPGSLLLGISSPYAKAGPLYEAFRAKYGQDDADTLVWRAPTKAMNPTIPDRVIDRGLKEDPSVGRAEWLAEFREDLETFLSTEVIEGAVIPDRRQLPKIDGLQYWGFIDPSGGRVDSMTLGIAHKNKSSGRVMLDRIEEKRPPFSPESVCKEFADILKSYGISKAYADRYGGEWPTQAFKKEGITVEPAKLNKSEIYLEFEPLIAQGSVELLDHKRLIAQLRGLERRTRSIGKDSVDHGPGGHDDICNSACGALVYAAQDKGDEFLIRWF